MKQTQTFTYQGKTYTYQIIKSNRKRIAITVTSDGKIQLRLPYAVTVTEGQQFLEQKRAWIVAQQRKIHMQLEQCGKQQIQHSFQQGDTFYYRGELLTLQLQENRNAVRARIEKCGRQIVLSGAPLTVIQRRKVIEEWFRRLAKIRFAERCQYYAVRLGVCYQMIRIKDQKSRWGSCSSKQNLNFNWRLIMAPDAVLDYVVIHELCHLKEMNHSEKFWKLVQSIMPDYKEKEQWLKEHQYTILQF